MKDKVRYHMLRCLAFLLIKLANKTYGEELPFLHGVVSLCSVNWNAHKLHPKLFTADVIRNLGKTK